jgi:hypothetical protein
LPVIRGWRGMPNWTFHDGVTTRSLLFSSHYCRT